MFLYKLFTYQPTERFTLHALYYRGNCIMWRLMDKQTHTSYDNKTTKQVLHWLTMLNAQVIDGLRPTAHFHSSSVKAYPVQDIRSFLPYFRSK